MVTEYAKADPTDLLIRLHARRGRLEHNGSNSNWRGPVWLPLAFVLLPDEHGRRPIHGADERYATGPNFRELLLFDEYFDGDTGRGCGASHQTGWTALVTLLENLDG